MNLISYTSLPITSPLDQNKIDEKKKLLFEWQWTLERETIIPIILICFHIKHAMQTATKITVFPMKNYHWYHFNCNLFLVKCEKNLHVDQFEFRKKKIHRNKFEEFIMKIQLSQTGLNELLFLRKIFCCFLFWIDNCCFLYF